MVIERDAEVASVAWKMPEPEGCSTINRTLNFRGPSGTTVPTPASLSVGGIYFLSPVTLSIAVSTLSRRTLVSNR